MLFSWLRSANRTNKNQQTSENRNISINKNIEKNKKILHQIVGDSPDVFWRDVTVEGFQTTSVLLVGVSGLIDEKSMNESMITPLSSMPLDKTGNVVEQVKDRLYVGDIREEENLYQGILDTFQGNAFLIIDGSSVGIVADVDDFTERDVEEPPTGTVVRGARDGFVENIETNLSLLRRRISHPSLRYQTYTLGDYSQTQVVLSYVEGIADPEILNRIQHRISEIEVDDIISGGQIEQYLADNPYTFFPIAGNTERPDQAAAKLMEGRVVLLVDGSPMTLFYPHFFMENMHNIEDYNANPITSSFVRLLRFIAFFISILLPAFYIAVVNIHKNVIPSKFLLALENSREGVPLPLVQETILLLLLFQIVKEAGVRMPKGVGEALSIVGALILGEVSVSAGLISPQTIIVVAAAAITSFIATPVGGAVKLLRLIYAISAAVLGFYGLMIAILMTLTHMVALKSMGVPYMSPVAPIQLKDWRDLIIRFPYNFLKFRIQKCSSLKIITI